MYGKVISLLFLGVGVFVLLQVILPLLSFQVWERKHLSGQVMLVSPDKSDSTQVLGVSIQNTDGDFPAIISNVTRREAAPFSYFYLTIPRLKISSEQVVVDSNNLAHGPAHLPGSALPGEKGNVFISGHSLLPQFAKGSNKAIFTNLADLKNGDLISLSSESGDFNYKVVGFRVVDPKDLSVIAPPDSQQRYVTLMTCVPPGLNTKRLVVLAKAI